MAAVLIRPNLGQRSRWRLFVLQVLMLSLFLTLFARLWYIQVLSGEAYQAQAADQSVRELVVQPARGLIVDDMGRPLVANRTAGWSASTARCSHKLGERGARPAAAPRRAGGEGAVPEGQGPLPDLRRARLEAGHLLERLALPAGARSPRTSRRRSRSRSSSSPRTSRRCSPRPQSVRAYPAPFGINAAHVLGYLSPITEGELTTAQKDDDRSVNGASDVGRAGLEKHYDPWLRGHARLQAGRRRLDGAGARRRQRGRRQPGRHPGHLDRRQGAGRGREVAAPGDR